MRQRALYVLSLSAGLITYGCGQSSPHSSVMPRSTLPPSSSMVAGDSPLKIDGGELVLTPYFTPWKFNETEASELHGRPFTVEYFKTFSAPAEIKVGWQQTSQSSCSGNADPRLSYTLYTLDDQGTRKLVKHLGLDERVVVQGKIALDVEIANNAICDEVLLTLGTNVKRR